MFCSCFASYFFRALWFPWVWVRESSAWSGFSGSEIRFWSLFSYPDPKKLDRADPQKPGRVPCRSIEPGKNRSQNKNRTQGKFIVLSIYWTHACEMKVPLDPLVKTVFSFQTFQSLYEHCHCKIKWKLPGSSSEFSKSKCGRRLLARHSKQPLTNVKIFTSVQFALKFLLKTHNCYEYIAERNGQHPISCRLVFL